MHVPFKDGVLGSSPSGVTMDIDISTADKKKEVLNLFRSFSYKKDIFAYYNVANNTQNSRYINNIATEIGFDFSFYKEKRKTKKYCLYCGLELTGKNKNKFCNSSCAASFNNKKRGPLRGETKKKISESLKKETTSDLSNKTKIYKSYTLKDKLYKDGLKERKCEICGITSWNGKEIVLQLHHINGDSSDNRIENLQILCPNCHSQTENYCSSNRKIKPKIHLCSKCGKKLYHTNISGLCRKCYKDEINKKPSKNDLLIQFNILQTYSSLAKHYKVTSKTIKKWLKSYNITH